MTDIPKAAIEAGAAAIYATMSRYPLSKAGETANRVCREEAEAAIRAALPHLDDAATRLADAYQIVGALAASLGVMDTPEVQSALDYLSGKAGAECPLPFVAPDLWRPIETAPKDGTVILVAITGGRRDTIVTAYWEPDTKEWWLANTDYDDYFASCIAEIMIGEVTHWMPLPEPPKEGR